jgi:hypothetical protein
MRALVAVAAIATLVLAACGSPSTRRIHDQHVAKAEAFKAMFDRDVRAGASFDEVLAYLKAHNLHFGPNQTLCRARRTSLPEMDTGNLKSKCPRRRAQTGIAEMVPWD